MRCFHLKCVLCASGRNSFLGCFLGFAHMLFSQISFFGDVHIGCATEVHIGFPVTYFKGGIIYTNRNCPTSAVSFRTHQQLIGAHNGSHVDGRVKVYQNGSFTFPLGASGIYSPMEVFVLHNPDALQIQYQHLHPLFYPVKNIPDFIPRLHYWSWEATDASAKIALPWRSEGFLESLVATHTQARNGFSNLKPAGLHQGQWEAIPGNIQQYGQDSENNKATAVRVMSHDRISFSRFTALTYILSAPHEQEKTIVSQAITPNGDGVNDFWKLKGVALHALSVIKVFDLHGVLVFFHKGNYADDWEGIHHTTGQRIPEGAYYFTIDTDGMGKAEKTGWIYIKYE